MRHCLYSLLCLVPLMLNAQNGPGGFESISPTSDLVLWLDASQLTDFVADQAVSIWTDQSGHSHHATQSTNSQQPTFKKAFLNGKGVISFIQSDDEFMSGSIANESGQFNAPATIISLVKFDKASQSNSSDNDYVISIGSEGPVGGNSGGEMTVIARRRNQDIGGGVNYMDRYYTYDGTDIDISDAAVLDDNSNWYIIVQIMRSTNSPDPYHSAFVNGSAVAYTTNAYIGPLASNGDYAVANWTLSADFPSFDYHLDGDIAETIVFDRELNDAEIRVMHAYLMAKWNGDAATDLDISSADTFTDLYDGDLAAQGHYDTGLIGVGQASSTDKLSTASESGLRLTTSSNFEDGDFVMAAHNVTTNTLSTDGLTGDQQRWSRVWYIDVTDAMNTATTTFTFDISDAGLGGDYSGNATNYDLLYKETEAGAWSFLSEAATYTGDQVEFVSVDLSANGSSNGDGYYTLVTSDKNLSPIGVEPSDLGDKGPGGIEDTNGTSNLELWLDASKIVANNGDLINGWADQSGHNAEGSQSSSTRQPEYDTDASPNSQPTLIFDGSNDYFDGNLAANPAAPLTIVSVANFSSLHQPSGDFDNDYVVSIGSTGSTSTEHFGIARRRDENNTGQGGSGGGQNQDRYYSWTGLGTSLGPEITGQTWTFITATHDISSQRHEVYFDGVKQTSPSPDYTGNIATTASDFNIGRWLGSSSDNQNYMNGEIAEVILFDEVLNAAKLNILHSYLAAKYEIDFTIADGDRYIGDCSAIVAMTDCTVAHNFDMDVAGIGTEGTGGASVSHTSASSAGMNIAMTAAETNDNGVNDTFDDGDYIMFGHNQAENEKATDEDISTTTSAVEGRIQRVWFLDITESDATGMLTGVTFDFSELTLTVFPAGSASNYKLLFRTDNTSGNDWTILASADAVSGDQVTFSDVSFTQDGFVTLGTLTESDSPLPVKLVDFDAQRNEVDDKVDILWSTASEEGNYGFLIERSANGLDFEELYFVEGQGSSNGLVYYQEADLKPLNGPNYYRLKQIDFNGNYSYSELRRVDFERVHTESLHAYPNPAVNRLRVELPLKEQSGKLFLRDQTGKVLIHHEVREESIDLDLTPLTSGLYMLEARWGTEVQTKKLIIRK